MSTRATYSFDGDGPRAVIYIHYDGYLKGAAVYFYLMLICPSKGNLATQFIRANTNAELTMSHEYHLDTEFRYHVSQLRNGDIILNVEQRRNDALISVYGGLLYEFVNQYVPKEYEPGVGPFKHFQPFQQVKLRFDNQYRWMNLITAHDHLYETKCTGSALPTLKYWDEHKVMNRSAANYRSVAGYILDLVTAFPELMTDEIRELTDISAPAMLASIIKNQSYHV